MELEKFKAIYGEPPAKVDYPGQKGDPAPNSRFQTARDRYERVREEIVKVVALITFLGEVVTATGEAIPLTARQKTELATAQAVCAKLGAAAYVVIRPTDLSELWLLFKDGGPQFMERVNGIFVEPRPAWIPIDPIKDTPKAAQVHAAAFVQESIMRGNAWLLADDSMLGEPARQRNEALIALAKQDQSQAPGVVDLPGLQAL